MNKKFIHEQLGEYEAVQKITQRMLESYWDAIQSAEMSKHGIAYLHRMIIESAYDAKILLGKKVEWLDKEPALIKWLANEIQEYIGEVYDLPKN